METPPRGSTGKLAGAFLSMLVVFAGEIGGYILSLVLGWDENILTTAGGALGAVIMMALLGGASYLKPSAKAIGKTFKFLWWIMAVAVLLMVWEFTEYRGEGYQISPDWLLRTIEAFALCMCIGISEEATFRGLVFGGLLTKLGHKRNTLMVATAVTAVLFGMAHIDWTVLSWSDPLSLAQAFLKICQTGMYSVMLSAVMLETHNITGPMLFHALDDFLLFVVSVGLFGESSETEYVTTSSTEDAIYSIIFYLIIIAIYAPTFYKSIKALLHDVEVPDFGPFIKRELVGAGGATPASPNGAGTYAPQPYYGAMPADISVPVVAPATGYAPAAGYAPTAGYAAGEAYGPASQAIPASGYAPAPVSAPTPEYGFASSYAPAPSIVAQPQYVPAPPMPPRPSSAPVPPDGLYR